MDVGITNWSGISLGLGYFSPQTTYQFGDTVSYATGKHNLASAAMCAMDVDLQQLKQRIPLLEYLQQCNWKARRAGNQLEFVGLCPLHRETHPSFYVNSRKNLFYLVGGQFVEPRILEPHGRLHRTRCTLLAEDVGDVVRAEGTRGGSFVDRQGDGLGSVLADQFVEFGNLARQGPVRLSQVSQILSGAGA